MTEFNSTQCKQPRAMLAESSGGYATTHGIPYREQSGAEALYENCLLDVYAPENIDEFDTVIWFHGGGMKAGERYVPEELQGQGLAVVAVSYRLNPEVCAPAYIEDAAAAVAWVFRHIEEYGGSQNSIIVCGVSAGAYLAILIGLDPSWLAPYGVDPVVFKGLASISGQAITHFTVREERGLEHSHPVIDDLAPLYHVRPDVPPVILITGDRDLELLGRYEENAYFYRMLKVVGHEDVELHELPGKDHGGVEAGAYEFLLPWLKRLHPRMTDEL